tara:strand:+ start:1189 stop:4164 length:2976 start_codon:yes stop_codon:yes gene_type:complete
MSFKSGTFATLAKKRHKREEEDENDENDANDANDAKRAATTTTKTKKTKKKRENGGALEWKDIVTNNVNADDPSQKPSSSVSNDDDNDDSEERGEKDTLDALMMKTGIVRAGTKKKNDDANANAMVKKKKNTEEDRARRKEAMHLKKELKNVNVKENNRNFERMFIGETIEVERMKTKENDAAHKNDDDDDDDDDDNEGWYYPRDWTLKTRATFAKICSLDDDDDNDDAEDFDEDFDEEKARKISSSKSFSWVNDERGANAASAGAHDAFSTHGVNGNEPLSSKSCSFFYCLPSSSNSIVSSESNKNDSRRSAAMQRATISFQYPDSRLPLHAIDKMNISFNDNQMSSAATNAWFRKRSDQWTEALSSAYGRLRSYFSYSFYVAYEDRRIFFACPGLDGSSNRSSSSAAGGGSSSNFSAEQAKEEEDNNNNNSSINDYDDDDECGSNSHSQGFAVITSTNQKLRDILTKNGIPFKPVFVTRDGKGFSVNDNQTKSDKMKNKKHLLFGGDANLFDVDDDGDDEKEEGEDNEKENEETGNRDHKKSNLQNSQDKDDGDGCEGGGGGGEDDDEDDDGDGDGYTNVTEKENDAVLKNAIHPTFIDAWNESKRKIKLKEEQEKNKVFERFNRDGAILVRGTLAVHGLINVLLQFRGQDPGDAKVTEQTVMDSEALALAQMSRATTTGAPAAAHKAHQGVKGKDAVNKIHSDVGAILAPRPFANCFTKSFELRPNKVATTSETSKSKFMRLWTLDLGSNNTNNSDSYSKKKHKMMSSTSSDRGWCDPCDLIPPWTMARVCRVLSMEDDFFGSNDDRDDGDAMDDTIATTKNNKNNTVKQNILHENKNSIRLWLDTDVCSKVLNASVAAARLMSEESFSRRRTSAQKKNDGKKDDSLMLLPSSCIWLKPRDEAFGDEDEKRWAFSSSSSSNRHRENFGKKNKDVSQDVGIVQSLEFKKKKNKKNKNKNKTSAFDEEDGRASTDEKRTAIEVVCARSWK